MSSLAAAQADGYYIDPSAYTGARGKRGSANAIAGLKNALSVRANPPGVIRFEMPHDVWCLGCGHHVALGTRFNAAKARVGAYHTTPVWEFRMACPSHSGCAQEFLVRTAPAEGGYEFVGGCVRKVKDWVPGALDGLGVHGGSLAASGAAERAREERAHDGIARLAHAADDARVVSAEAARLAVMADDAERRYGDRLAANGTARAVLRDAAARDAAALSGGAARGLPGLAIYAGSDSAQTAAAHGGEEEDACIVAEAFATRDAAVDAAELTQRLERGKADSAILASHQRHALLAAPVFPLDAARAAAVRSLKRPRTGAYAAAAPAFPSCTPRCGLALDGAPVSHHREGSRRSFSVSDIVRHGLAVSVEMAAAASRAASSEARALSLQLRARGAAAARQVGGPLVSFGVGCRGNSEAKIGSRSKQA